MRILSNGTHPYLPSWKAMTVRFYVHTNNGQTVGEALINSGATECFMQLPYARRLKLPIQDMAKPQMVYNVDGMPNKCGEIKYYMDLNMQIGSNYTTFQFFLTGLGDQIIFGYPWMAAIQPCINWKRGWINHNHLPIVLQILGLC